MKPERVVIYFPAPLPTARGGMDHLRAGQERFRVMASRHLPHPLPAAPVPARTIGFEPDWRPIALRSTYLSDTDLQLVGDAGADYLSLDAACEHLARFEETPRVPSPDAEVELLYRELADGLAELERDYEVAMARPLDHHRVRTVYHREKNRLRDQYASGITFLAESRKVAAEAAAPPPAPTAEQAAVDREVETLEADFAAAMARGQVTGNVRQQYLAERARLVAERARLGGVR